MNIIKIIENNDSINSIKIYKELTKEQLKQVINILENNKSKVCRVSDDVMKYIDAMYSEAKGRKSPGLNKIIKKTGLKLESARTIKGLLERKGIIRCIEEPGNNRTIILKQRNELGIWYYSSGYKNVWKGMR